MPTYDYKCLDCGHKFSVFIPISEKDKVSCAHCKSINLSQIYNTVGILVKSSPACSSSGCGG